MILARASTNGTALSSCVALALAMGGASAQADVLAVGPEGAQWVAGGPPMPSSGISLCIAFNPTIIPPWVPALPVAVTM